MLRCRQVHDGNPKQALEQDRKRFHVSPQGVVPVTREMMGQPHLVG